MRNNKCTSTDQRMVFSCLYFGNALFSEWGADNLLVNMLHSTFLVKYQEHQYSCSRVWKALHQLALSQHLHQLFWSGFAFYPETPFWMRHLKLLPRARDKLSWRLPRLPKNNEILRLGCNENIILWHMIEYSSLLFTQTFVCLFAVFFCLCVRGGGGGGGAYSI